ncbi:MAG: nucleic acid/nucleotide deaminase domain-containing protein [Methyloceanibacter sp.]
MPSTPQDSHLTWRIANPSVPVCMTIVRQASLHVNPVVHPLFIARPRRAPRLLPPLLQVTRTYSELQPRNVPGGYCDPFISRTFPQAEVTWSFEYGATVESRAAGVEALRRAGENLRR